MIIAVIKFLHLFCALTLFALMLFNFVALVTKKTALSCKTDYAALTVILINNGDYSKSEPTLKNLGIDSHVGALMALHTE